MKKVMSIILSFVLCLSLALPAFAGSYDEKPTIYVTGAQTNDLYSADGVRIYPRENENGAEAIKNALIPCLEKLMIGLITDDYKAYAEEFHAAFMEFYGDLALDENGEPGDGSHPQYTIYNCGTPRKDHGYGEFDYRFWYDWRISPLTAAEDLKIYIDMVKEATGESKVNLMGRCYGANVIQAYLTLYTDHALESVDDVAYLASSIEGIDMLGSIFAGELVFEDQAVTNFANFFLNNENVIQDEVTYAFVVSFLEVFQKTEMLGITGHSLELLIDRLESDLIPMILKDSFGSMPAYWAMVPEEKYEKAREFIFEGEEEKYAGLIDKIDTYYYDVQLRTKDTLLALDKAGIDFYIVSKYNFPDYPLYEGATALSDGNTRVTEQSFGAVCADYGEVLSEKYVNALEDTKYLSPDHKIDASTCLFPETSYFIKDLHHDLVPPSMNYFVMDLMNYEATVSGGEYAQYLDYVGWNDPLVPVEGLDEDATKEETPEAITFIRFFTALMNFITKLLKGDFNFGFNLEL